MPDDSTDQLESWKEIAAFVGKDVRTAMRWSHQGMPIRRIPGGKQGRVYGSRSEITQWLSGQRDELPSPSALPESNSRKVLRWALIAGTIVILVGAVAGFAFLHPRAAPGLVSFRDNSVHVSDAEGHELWKYEYPRRFDLSLFPPDTTLDDFARITDLFGDGHREVVVVAPYRLGPNPEDSFRVEVDCFSDRGRLLWSYVPEAAFRFGSHDIGGPWKVYDLFISDGRPSPGIWVAVTHTLWGNSFVVEIDPRTGHPTTRFVNTGIIYKLNEVVTGDGRYLLVAGFNNEHDSGSLAVVDERTPYAVSPQTRGTRHYCDSCLAGSPNYYLVFPRSEINRVEGVYEDPVRSVVVTGSEIQLVKFELQTTKNGVATIYLIRIGSTIEPVSLRYESNYEIRHRALTVQGKLNHPLDQCPERLYPQTIKMWTPSEGWTLLTFPAAKPSA
jgi:hypothetical protein